MINHSHGSAAATTSPTSPASPAPSMGPATRGASPTPPSKESASAAIRAIETRYSAPNYAPLPVVLATGEGCWVTDVDGKRYLDMLAGYSALSFGHRHPRIHAAFLAQANRLTVVSRAFESDQFGPFAKELAEFCGMEQILPMNTGAEAVETAIKTARKWAYRRKGVPAGKAEIIACNGNFHGRTTTIVGFSSTPQYRDDFGPATPGFRLIPFGDVDALRRAITSNTAAFLVEPIQGEGGINVPPIGYLRHALEVCREHAVLFMVDEVQTGLGRTGARFACDHENVKPDLYILGKALGGGMLASSAVVSSREIFSVFRPGDHGSTFGGNPLAAAVGRESLRVLVDEKLSERAASMGEYLRSRLRSIKSPAVKEIRGRGLLNGIQISPAAPGHRSAHDIVEALMHEGVLCKETANEVVRITPPLTISQTELDWGLERIERVLS